MTIKQLLLWDIMANYSLTIIDASSWNIYLKQERPLFCSIHQNAIKILDRLVHSGCLEKLVRWCYPVFNFTSSENSSTAILAPRNEDVEILNDNALNTCIFRRDTVTVLNAENIKVQHSLEEVSPYPWIGYI